MIRLGSLVPAISVQFLGTRVVDCPDHGGYLARVEVIRSARRPTRELVHSCPRCVAEREAAERASVAAQAAAEMQRRADELMARARIPRRFLGVGLDAYRAAGDGQARALRVCQRYVGNLDLVMREGRGLALCGSLGTGKTHLALAILQAALQRYSGLYLTALDAVRIMRSARRYGSSVSELEAADRLASVDLLVLDEVGVGALTEQDRDELFALVDRRYLDRRPMIVCSNRRLDEMGDLIGGRAVDRMSDMLFEVVFDWASHRGAAAA